MPDIYSEGEWTVSVFNMELGTIVIQNMQLQDMPLSLLIYFMKVNIL